MYTSLGSDSARLIAAFLLLWALGAHPYGFYVLLRWVVCAVAMYSALEAYGRSKKGLVWILGVMALIFNPFIPVYLDRAIWRPIDLLASILLVVAIPMLRLSPKDQADVKQL
ncbi:MAG TPA: DUF6804 family protein [Thermoanaerobaculia bacterium]